MMRKRKTPPSRGCGAGREQADDLCDGRPPAQRARSSCGRHESKHGFFFSSSFDPELSPGRKSPPPPPRFINSRPRYDCFYSSSWNKENNSSGLPLLLLLLTGMSPSSRKLPFS
mmetsp:Transcript_11890/g.23394  ORF Transcript_11890/g.23394 Transcript_11890/m.23394 type:complete len:114 (+) Transcript_11890:200-541(+)